ncbi:MAG: hypothetical protein ABIH46_02385 [Chloroflexota bacterium]
MVDEQYEVVLRRKRKTPPTWLKPYQDRFKEAMRIAGEETRHLKGPERVKEMNRLARMILKQKEPV